MSKVRLQVVMEAAELREIRRAAKRNGLTVSAWVRQVLRQARMSTPASDEGRKLAVVTSAYQHGYPIGDIDDVMAEIEAGYLSGP